MSMALCFEHLPAFASLARRAGIPQDSQDPQESRPLRWIVDSRIDNRRSSANPQWNAPGFPAGVRVCVSLRLLNPSQCRGGQ